MLDIRGLIIERIKDGMIREGELLNDWSKSYRFGYPNDVSSMTQVNSLSDEDLVGFFERFIKRYYAQF